MLTIFVTVIHVVMCLILIAIVLLQSGKGASMGAAFGGGSNTLFGSAGPASFLNKVTTIAAVVFMITSFTLAIVSSRGDVSSRVLDQTPTEEKQPVEQEKEQEAPIAPAEEASSLVEEEEAPAAPPAASAETEETSSSSEEETPITTEPPVEEEQSSESE